MSDVDISTKVAAVCVSKTAAPSVRADRLDARLLGLVKYTLENVTVMGCPCCAIEVKLDRPLYNIGAGGDGLALHGISSSLEYIKHYNDPEWAVIFDHDCAGEWDNALIDALKSEFKAQYA